MTRTYDLIVIGAGSGGLVAATSGHRKGLKTALIEKNKIGGECTHFGCVPSKALINAAHAYHNLPSYSNLGIQIEKPEMDFNRIMTKVDEVVQHIYDHERPEVFENMGIDVFVDKSGAKFIDQNTISIGEKTLTSKSFVICSGSSPKLPEIEGINAASILTNENFWELRTLPSKIVFIGGGVISTEIGQALAHLGSKVTIIDQNNQILSRIDSDIVSHLTEQLKRDGIEILTNVKPKRFATSNALTYIDDVQEKEIEADYFFIATGRTPNTKGLALDNAGVTYDKYGISTNEYLQTSNETIYACGDVTTKHKFTHTAAHQANIIVDNIIEPKSRNNDLSLMPWGIFTQPQIGHVGLSEQEAKSQLGDENVKVFMVDASIDRYITDRISGGFLKVIFDNNHKVIGADAIGAYAAEWIQLLTIVIKNKILAKQMAETIFIYPTYSEIVKKAFTRFLRSLNV